MEKKEASDNEEIQAETPKALKEMKFDNVDNKKKGSSGQQQVMIAQKLLEEINANSHSDNML
jgi:hypothetical protein